MDNCTLVRLWTEMMNSFICSVKCWCTDLQHPLCLRGYPRHLVFPMKTRSVNNSHNEATHLLFKHWERIHLVSGFHTCSPLGPGSPRPPCHAQHKSVNWLNSRCRTKKARDVLFVHTRGSWSADCCWALISLLPLKTIHLEMVSERACGVFFLPSLLSPRAGQEDQGDQGGRGHLWVPVAEVEAGLWHLFLHCWNSSNISGYSK